MQVRGYRESVGIVGDVATRDNRAGLFGLFGFSGLCSVCGLCGLFGAVTLCANSHSLFAPDSAALSAEPLSW